MLARPLWWIVVRPHELKNNNSKNAAAGTHSNRHTVSKSEKSHAAVQGREPRQCASDSSQCAHVSNKSGAQHHGAEQKHMEDARGPITASNSRIRAATTNAECPLLRNKFVSPAATSSTEVLARNLKQRPYLRETALNMRRFSSSTAPMHSLIASKGTVSRTGFRAVPRRCTR